MTAQREPDVSWSAPGRLNLIGDHTDYNEGYVLPMGLDARVQVDAEATNDWAVVVESDGYEGEARITAAGHEGPTWGRYPAAVLELLWEAGLPKVGLTAKTRSDVPEGAGLGSSAAFDVAFACAVIEVARGTGAELSACFSEPVFLAELCRDAELRGAGVRCGLMDPLASLVAPPRGALLIDCQTRDWTKVGWDSSKLAFVVADTGVDHDHSCDGYNRRRSECEEAVTTLRAGGMTIDSLRDLAVGQIPDAEKLLGQQLARRVRHVVTENERVLAAAAFLPEGEFEAVGELMAQSHKSLRDDYQVSCPELDLLVSMASRFDGVYGCRMTGGGFGGCCVAAVKADRAPAFLEFLRDRYQGFTGAELDARVVVPSAGALRYPRQPAQGE